VEKGSILRVLVTSPLADGLSAWRASEAVRRLAAYALPAAIACLLLAPLESMALRTVVAAGCLVVAGAAVVVPRIRRFAPELQVVNVGALLVVALLLVVDERRDAFSLGIAVLAIFVAQYAFVRRRDLAVVYTLGLIALLGYAAYRNAFDATGGAMIVAVAVALLVAYAARWAQITAQLRLLDAHAREEGRLHLDPLTGLQNREVLFERLDCALASSKRRRHDVAVLYVDLDRFKSVNDTFGHRAGDEVLVQVGCRLKRAVRTDEVAARVGGDEFVVLLPHVEGFNEPAEAAARITRVLEEPFAFDGRELAIGASIGVARSPYDGSDRDRLLATADAAMYANKRTNSRAAATA
jgi:diguanylate cyclase (GGDEF)-like protein